MIINGHSCRQYGVAAVIQLWQFGAPVIFLLAVFSLSSRKFLALCVQISLIQKEMPFSVMRGFSHCLAGPQGRIAVGRSKFVFYFLALVLVIIIQQVPWKLQL